jgi:hypothetical protein
MGRSGGPRAAGRGPWAVGPGLIPLKLYTILPTQHAALHPSPNNVVLFRFSSKLNEIDLFPGIVLYFDFLSEVEWQQNASLGTLVPVPGDGAVAQRYFDVFGLQKNIIKSFEQLLFSFFWQSCSHENNKYLPLIDFLFSKFSRILFSKENHDFQVQKSFLSPSGGRPCNSG